MNGTLVQTPMAEGGAFSAVRLSPKGKEMAEKFAEARQAFTESEWELAKMLTRELSLSWSMAYHLGEWKKTKQAIDACRSLKADVSKDERYNALLRIASDQHGAMQCASRLFMGCMKAWADYLGLRDDDFVEKCSQIVQRLRNRLAVEIPPLFGDSGFASLYRVMKKVERLNLKNSVETLCE